MFIPARAALARNLAVAFSNGLVTLIILLIAPLGLLAVVINTALVAVSTFAIATAADRVVLYLLEDGRSQAHLDQGTRPRIVNPSNQLPSGDRTSDSSDR